MVSRQAMAMAPLPVARFGEIYASDLVNVSNRVEDLDTGGRWAVAIPFEGEPVLARFATWSELPIQLEYIGPWTGISPDSWTSSLDRQSYVDAVSPSRSRI